MALCKLVPILKFLDKANISDVEQTKFVGSGSVSVQNHRPYPPDLRFSTEAYRKKVPSESATLGLNTWNGWLVLMRWIVLTAANGPAGTRAYERSRIPTVKLIRISGVPPNLHGVDN